MYFKLNFVGSTLYSDVMFKKILIANRGEIAVRVIRAARELGISVVAICSEPDRDAMHVQLADEVYLLSGPPAKVYLDGAQIIDLAKRAHADAIHPGYGFLAENADFAKDCVDAGIVFIGPKREVIAGMGSKVEARRVMQKAGVPVVPGTTDPVTDPAVVKELAGKYGYPIAIKASAGGGGRGMKVVRQESEVEQALASAQREGQSYFGSSEVYVEKYLDTPHHVEIQIIGDNQGDVVHLFERDCSSQRRHQKLLEETPSTVVNDDLRARIVDAGVRAAKALGYSSAGTIECLVSGNDFYFLEVNTRIQVEHPITEMVTGIDLVKEQILVASGKPLSFTQKDVKTQGHAIECRINAEDPLKNFMPSPGTIKKYLAPQMPWVRVDSACYTGYQVLPFYDSLLAKLIVWGRTREEAIARTKIALSSYVIEGVPTTIPFHLWLLDQKDFVAGKVDTNWVEKHFQEFVADYKQAKPVEKKPAEQKPGEPQTSEAPPPKQRLDSRTFEVVINQQILKVTATELVDGDKAAQKEKVSLGGKQPRLVLPPRPVAQAAGSLKAQNNGHSAKVCAEMHGLVKEILVKEGDSIKKGQKLIIFEAMKMESEITSHREGKIVSVHVKPGETVEASGLLLTLGD